MAREFRVRISEQGAIEVDGNVKFTCFLPAGSNDHRLQRVPVVTSQIPAVVTQARTESRPFTVHVMADADLLAELADAGRWAILGSLLDVAFRDSDTDPWTVYGTGRISSIGEPDGPGIIPIEVSDEGWVARKGQVFIPDPEDASTWNTCSIWPLGTKASWRGFAPAPKAAGTLQASDGNLHQIALRAGGAGWPGARHREVTERMIRWIQGNVRDDINVGTGADQGNFEHLRLNYGGTDYEVVSFGPMGAGASRADLTDTLEEPDIQNPQAGTRSVTIRAWIYSPSTPPASGSAYLHAPTGQPSDDLPLHIGISDASHKWGATGGWIHFADLERRIADELGLIYDSTNYDEREADTSLPLLAPRITEIPDDIETWLQREVRSSLMHIALRDARGRRKLVDLRLPNADDVNLGTLPVLDASNTRAHTWQLLGREAVNVISWKYLRLAPPYGTQTFPDAPSVSPDEVALDGLHAEEQTWDPIEGDTIQGLGHRTLTLSLKGALEPTADIGRKISATQGGRGTLFVDAARVMGSDILDVYQDGAFRGRIEVGRTLAEALEEGDMVILDHDSLKGANPGTQARSGQRIARVLALTRHPAHAECEYLDLGPNLAPLSPPSIAITQDGSDIVVQVTNTPQGARVRLEVAYTGSSAEPTTWVERRTNLGDGNHRFKNAPGGGWVHARARSEAEGRVRSVWVADSLQLGVRAEVGRLEVILDDAGVPTLFGEPNGQAEGLRIRYDVYQGNQQPNPDNPSDHAAADLAIGITFSNITVPSPDPIASAVLFAVEPWTGFAGGSVFGTPGPIVLVQKVRAQILFEHLNPRGLIELVSDTDDDETLRFTGELGEGGIDPLEYRFAVTGLHAFTEYEPMPSGEIITDGTGDNPGPIPRGDNNRTVLLQVRDAGGRESQVASYTLGTMPIGRDRLDPDLEDDIDRGILADVDLSLIEEIDRQIHRVTGFQGEGILARLDGVGSNEILADSVTALHLAALAVTSAKLAENAVTTTKLANAAVAAGKLAVNAVTEETINDLAITADKVAASAITTAKIANNAVQAAKLADGAATEAKIATDAITQTKISDNAVVAPKIAAGAIEAGKLAASAVQASNIEAGAVIAAKIAAGAVTTAKLDALAVTADKIATNTITAIKIASNAITAAKIDSNAITAAKIAANAIQASHIAAGEINANHIGANQILTTHLAADSVTASKIQSISLVTLQATVGSLSALVADLGDIAAGRIRNPGTSPGTRGILVSGTLPGAWTRYIDLTATGSEPFLQHPGLSLLANGTVQAGNMQVGGALNLVATTTVFIEATTGACTIGTPGGSISILPAGSIFLNNQQISFGANGSAGAGFRTVRVPNS